VRNWRSSVRAVVTPAKPPPRITIRRLVIDHLGSRFVSFRSFYAS
jgi:hypothetical protein